MKVLLTGATGFVGRALSERLLRSGHGVRAALRKEGSVMSGVSEKIVVGDIGSATDWRAALPAIDAVIHVAARVHVLHDSPAHAHLYEETNAVGTRNLALAAAAAGVRRFVYLSTVKVNGEETIDRAYSAEDTPHPVGAYAISKWNGERYLREVADRSSMIVAIVRSPLIYGPGVQANFLRLMRWVRMGLPIPLGSVRNARSLVSICNLCDLLVDLLNVSALSSRTWMVSDGEDLSTPELIRRIGRAMDRRAQLIPMPVSALKQCARLFGKRDEIGRLCGSLVVDSQPTRQLLRWSPPVTVDDAIARTVSWFLSQPSHHAS